MEPTPDTTVENIEDAPPAEMAEAPVSPADETAAAASPAAPPGGGSMPRTRPLRPAAGDDSAFETDVPATDAPRTAMNDPALLPEIERPAARAAGAEQIPVGRLVNDSEVLLHGDGTAGAWQRLSTRDALMAEDELIALPTFRPGVALSTGGGAIAHLLGGSVVVRLTAADANGVPGLQIIDGQVVVATAGKPGTELNVQVNDQIYHGDFPGTRTRGSRSTCGAGCPTGPIRWKNRPDRRPIFTSRTVKSSTRSSGGYVAGDR